ncbi:peroxisome proliferator-activated receptor gamma coactivator 1-alpha [Sardina pilchardus]|uniref:peroxisome proliferator-activated receptor gamma coactivator 1-alpha n=1 Tax=Sardina pilchardus TaxID=27697 RepID=UPI002E1010CF
MAWDRGHQDSVWRDIECAALVGEDQPLCPDLPELDLSELDVSDLDDSFLGGLKWYSDQSEIISSQYGNEPSNLFEKIDEEQEANLLAVLSETLDSIPVDEDGLPSFDSLADGEVPRADQSNHSCPPSPALSPRSPETEEPSLLKRLLLAPAHSQISYSQFPPATAPQHALNQRRHTHTTLKVEQPWLGKRGCVSMRRPCTELLKYLTTVEEAVPTATVATSCSSSSSPSSLSSFRSSSSSCSASSGSSSSSRKKSSFRSSSSSCSASSPLGHAHLLPQRAKPRPLPLPLTPESPTHKGSPLESKAIERTLSVEISGTPGLTPPTTPPHKLRSPENPFPDSSLPVVWRGSVCVCVGVCVCESAPAVREGCVCVRVCVCAPVPPRRPPQQTALYAHLRKDDRRGNKRPAPRGYGDHDYCQATSAKQHTSATAVATTTARTTAAMATAVALSPHPPTPPHPSDLPTPGHAHPARAPPPRHQDVRAELDRHFGRRPQQQQQQQQHPPHQQALVLKPPRQQGALQALVWSQEEELREEAELLWSQQEESVPGGEEGLYCELGGYGCLEEGPKKEGEELKQEEGLEPEEEGLKENKEELSCELEQEEEELNQEEDELYCELEQEEEDLNQEEEGLDCELDGLGCLEAPELGAGLKEGAELYSWEEDDWQLDLPFENSASYTPPHTLSPAHRASRSRSPHNKHTSSWSRFGSDLSLSRSRSRKSPQSYSRRPRFSYGEQQQEFHYDQQQHQRHTHQREHQRQQAIEERRVLYVGRLRPDSTHSELKRRFEVFGEIEECAVNLRHHGDNVGFITYRYTCDASSALCLGHTLQQEGEHTPQMELDSHSDDFGPASSDDFDPASSKSKYDCMDFDSLLQEAQSSLRR